MKLAALCLLGVLGVSWAVAQDAQPRVRRQAIQLRVRSADPWAIKALLEGQQIFSPEISTVLAIMGVPPQATQGTTGMFSDGKLLINPADNSIWFIPN